MFKRILVPVDFSEPSLCALDRAIDFGAEYKSDLTVLHVVEPLFMPGGGDAFGSGYDVRLVYEELERSARERLARLSADLAEREVAVRTLLRVGTAHEVIVAAARQTKADLIIMSTHGRTGLAHLTMGSVAERVVRNATCPVMTIRGVPAGAPTARRRSTARAGRRARAVA